VDKGRLEAFSDGVIAILITIMVLELHPPEDTTLEALRPLVPAFACYVLSFVYLGIYWNNHHHLLQAAKLVDGRVLWANMFLLFWLSLVPFATAWMGEGGFASVPTSLYACILLAAALSYSLLVTALRRVPGQTDTVARASGTDRKGLMSVAIYAAAIMVAMVVPLVAFLLYVIVACIWIVPDRRVERALGI
jgi:TMEM175 potassium channel family protein